MAVDPTNLVASQLAGFTNAPQLAPGQIFPTGLNFGGGLNPLGNPLAGGFAVPGPLAGTPEGNIEGMMLGMLGESSVSQGMMMNFINEMFTSYDQLAKSYVGMLGKAAPAAAAADKAAGA